MARAFTNALAVVPPRIEILCLNESLVGRIQTFCGDRPFELREAEGPVTDESFLGTVWRSKWAE